MNNRSARILAIAIYLVTILCLPASVGADQVFAYQSQPKSLGNQNMPQSPGDLTLHGQFYYFPQDSIQSVPAKYYLVGIYTATNPEQLLSWGYTDDAGHFAIGPFVNPGKLRVKIYSF